MSIDNLRHIPVRPAPGSPLGLRLENERLRKESKILQETSAFHGIFALPQDSETVSFSLLNPSLKQLFISNNSTVPNYLGKKLKEIVTANNWQENPLVSTISALNEPEAGKTTFFGLTIEKIGSNQFHLTGRDITDNEIIRQQEEYEKNHDPDTGYLNAFGWKQLSQKINQEKRNDLKPKTASFIYFDLNGVGKINNTISHEAGTKYIVESFHKIAKCFRTDDILIRIHNTGDELVAYLPDINLKKLDIVLQRLNSLREENPSKLNFYFGTASGTPDSSGNFNFPNIINEADIQQNKDKNLKKGIE